MRWMIFLICLLTMSGIALAEKSQVLGAGNVRCDNYARMTKANPSADDIFANWAMGYLSGVATAKPSAFKNIEAWEPEQVAKFIRGYCDKHPSDFISMAQMRF